MIICKLSDSDTYAAISPRIAKALEWLKAHAADPFAPGTTDLGDDIVVKAETPALMPREKARLEAHRRYIDIHVPIKGVETIGWAPVNGLSYLRQPYDEEKDIEFYGDSAHSLLHVRPGEIAIFFPEDAHAPNIGLGNHRKLCVKIGV